VHPKAADASRGDRGGEVGLGRDERIERDAVVLDGGLEAALADFAVDRESWRASSA